MQLFDLVKKILVGARGFEPPTTCTPCSLATTRKARRDNSFADSRPIRCSNIEHGRTRLSGKRTRLYWTLLPLFLAACGGGGGDSTEPQAAPAPATAPAPKTVLIEAYGDSTMYGFASTSPTTGAYTDSNAPAYLQQFLRGIYGPVVTVANEGVGGTTLGELIAGKDGKHLPWAQQMANSHAQVVIVNHGMNDVLAGVGETPDQYRALLVEFVTVARQNGKTPVFDEPNPACDTQHNALASYVKIMDDVGQQMGVPVVSQFAYIQTLPNWQGYLADCIHPSPALYAIKAQRMAVVLSPLVANLLK